MAKQLTDAQLKRAKELLKLEEAGKLREADTQADADTQAAQPLPAVTEELKQQTRDEVLRVLVQNSNAFGHEQKTEINRVLTPVDTDDDDE